MDESPAIAQTSFHHASSVTSPPPKKNLPGLGTVPTPRRAICWWTLGHGFAYGSDVGGFIGTDSFAFSNYTVRDEEKGVAIAQWFFQWAFAGAGGAFES